MELFYIPFFSYHFFPWSGPLLKKKIQKDHFSSFGVKARTHIQMNIPRNITTSAKLTKLYCDKSHPFVYLVSCKDAEEMCKKR